jgi:hypothetical protein
VVLAALVWCAWCGWASGFHRSTTGAWVTWFISLAAVVLVDVSLWLGSRGRLPAWRLPRAREPWPRQGAGGSRGALAGLWPWIVLVLVVVAWEILGIDTGAHEPHLTISALTQAFRPLDAAMLLVWMAAGVGYGVARARAPMEISIASPSGPVLAASPPALLLPRSQAAGIAFWLAVVVVAVLLDLWGRASHGRRANAEELVRFLTHHPVPNVILVVAWTYAGYHLFAH